jgi:hypothetical protein
MALVTPTVRPGRPRPRPRPLNCYRYRPPGMWEGIDQDCECTRYEYIGVYGDDATPMPMPTVQRDDAVMQTRGVGETRLW